MRTVILGKGGHAQAVADMLVEGGHLDFECTDDNSTVDRDVDVAIGVGHLWTRRRLFERFHKQILHGGRQYMKGAIVYLSARIGVNVLVNTGAQVDHDCVIGDHCVIGPGAVLCGNVTLGAMCEIGAGAIILQGVSLPDGTRVPAGTLVVGPDDFRKPVRMVRRDGEDTLAIGAETIGQLRHFPARQRPDPDP